MADVLSAIRTYLLNKPEISSDIGQRIYFDVLPQRATLPAVVMSTLSQTDQHTLSDRTGFQSERITFEATSGNRLQSREIIRNIKASGIAAVKGVTNGVDIRGVQVEMGIRDWIDSDTAGGDEPRRVSAFDLMVQYLDS